MAERKKPSKKKVEHYTHPNEKRPNNPQVGLVTPDTDPDQPRKRYSFDPRIDPQLQWSGKQENSEFDVDTVSLHVHERIDPITILEKVLKKEPHQQQSIFAYFETPENNPPLREAIEFYKHEHGWANRLIAGDSLIVMNSLLEKEGMVGKVQMIYIDPPYGIKYGSNFQPFVNKYDVKDGKDEDLTSEPETLKAFRDTWELGIHSYLSYLRQRLLLVRELLTDSGSCFVQISDENVHLVRVIMDEIFGRSNFISLITFRRKPNSMGAKIMGSVSDHIIWYAKDKKHIKSHKLFESRNPELGKTWSFIELSNGIRRKLTKEEIEKPNSIPPMSKIFTSYKLAPSAFSQEYTFPVMYKDKKYLPPYTGGGRCWKTTKEGMDALIKKDRVLPSGDTLRFVGYWNDFPYVEIDNLWYKISTTGNKIYVVETSSNTISRCILMTTDPGDLVLDITCGSGTTAYTSEKLGRRWITCDTSRLAITLAKQRLMTGKFDYYEIMEPTEGVSSGFKYDTAPHITLGTIANNEPPLEEILYDKPKIDKSKVRITGPFTVEAVPSPTVKSLDVLSHDGNSQNVQHSNNSPQEYWRDELLKTGIRGKNKQKIEFTHVESHPATKWLHADAETKEDKPKRVMISFGPEHAPLEQRQVASAIEEAQSIVPKPKMIIFAAMQFDPEAAKDIDELKWPGVTVLKVEMNKDLLTKDLKKKRSTNESFWLVGQPDVELDLVNDVDDGGKNSSKKDSKKSSKNGKANSKSSHKDDDESKRYIIRVNGFDYYNTNTDEIESGDSSKIAMWMLDTDYDGRSVYPQQVFFPMEGDKGGWSKLAKTLQAQIDDELISKYHGTVSIPFTAGPNKRAAVKIIDDRGIESLKIIQLE